MKILWFSHFVPYPPRGGNKQRSYNLLAQAARQHEIYLVAFDLENLDQAQRNEAIGALQSHCRSVEILDLPIRWRSAAWWAKLALSPLLSLPYAASAFKSAPLKERFAALLAREKFAVVHLDSLDLIAYADLITSPFVLNHHNCESAMLFRRSNLAGNPLAAMFFRMQAQKTRDLEQRWCPQAAANLSVSAEDAASLGQIAQAARFTVIENGTDTEFFYPRPELLQENTLVFAGSLSWYPNVSGLRFFLDQVWPRVLSASPATKMFVAGKTPAPAFLAYLRSRPQVEVLVSPEDIRPTIAAGAVYVCPILDGGGSRLKLLDAMSMGKAIVSTTVGAEGLDVIPGKHLVVADQPEDFAARTLTLLRDPERREQLAQAARELAQQHYGWNVIGPKLNDVYEALRK